MMKVDYKNLFKRFESGTSAEPGFTRLNKAGNQPAPNASPLSAAQKAALNRKGNVFYNNGDIEAARRVFLTTGYSDGLTRVGDYYKSHGRILDALGMYWAAPDKAKSGALLEKAAAYIEHLLSEDAEHNNANLTHDDEEKT
jgi:hypothetical protein